MMSTSSFLNLGSGGVAPSGMTPDDYLLLGYVLGFVLLFGYAVNLWLVDRWLRKRERAEP